MLPELRVILAFVLALAPVTIAAALDGPSLGLFAAFGSGCLTCVVLVALQEREQR